MAGEKHYVSAQLNEKLFEIPSDPDTLEFQRLLWSSEGRNVNGQNMTILDTFRLAGEPEDVICSRLEQSETVLRDPNNPTTKEIVANVNEALIQAHSYLTEFLGLTLPAPLKKPARVESFEDLVELLKKTALYGKGHENMLPVQASYCAYMSVALATYELQKEESHLLQNEMGYVEDFFTKPNKKNGHSPLLIPITAGQSDEGKTYRIKGIEGCNVTLSFRGKTTWSQITKFLMKPEASAAEALKDGFGIRFEAPDDRLEEVMKAVLSYVHSVFEAGEMNVENVNTFGASRFANFIEKMEATPFGETLDFVIPKENKISSSNYQAMKVLSRVTVPTGGEIGAMNRERPIEIQFTPVGNRNESGLSNHHVYDLMKKVQVMTRLFGGCKGKWLTEQASRIPDLGPAKIKQAIEGLKKNRKLIPLPKMRDMWASAATYERWYKADALAEPIRSDIAHALGDK